MPYSVQVLKMGQCQVRGPEVYWMDRWDDWEELYFYKMLVPLYDPEVLKRFPEGKIA
jgi:hypothetical protein